MMKLYMEMEARIDERLEIFYFHDTILDKFIFLCGWETVFQFFLYQFTRPFITETMARFILETDDLSSRMIHLTDHSSKYKHKTNYRDELW
jgi:hypothetical protein